MSSLMVVYSVSGSVLVTPSRHYRGDGHLTYLALIKYLTDKILWATFDRVQINLTYVKQHGAKDK